MSDSLTTLLSVIVLLGGPLMTGFCLYETMKSLRLVTGGRVAKGRITKIRWGRNRSGRQIAYPTVAFTTASGEHMTHDSQTSFSPPRHKIGDAVQIRYMPGQPAICSIDSFGHLWLGPLILGVIGIPWLLYGIGALTACGGSNVLACLGQ